MTHSMTEQVQAQIAIEKENSKNFLIPRLLEELKAGGVKEFIENNDLDPRAGMYAVAQLMLHRRCDVSTLVGMVRSYFSTSQEAADFLSKLVDINLIGWDEAYYSFVTRATIPDSLQLELDRFQYPMPMVIEPKKVSSNKEYGYYSIRGSILLGGRSTNKDVCLDHINRMNWIPLTIDKDIASMVHQSWRSLDKPKEGETWDDYRKRLTAFNKYDRVSREVIDRLLEISDKIYLTHRYDERGRTYCQGYHVNYQGHDWNKAVIHFHNEELVHVD